MTDAECVAFLQWALPRLQLRWDGFRRFRGQVCKRLHRRLEALALPDLAAYRALLESQPEEWRTLDALCRVTISRFFRDRAVFSLLGESLLPALLEELAARGQRLRIWSAGCASGEEPYSVALLFRYSLAPRFPRAELDLLATDADPQLLERARRACYQRGTLRELPADWVRQAFAMSGDLMCLSPEIRALVQLRCQDLRQEIPEGPWHVILCRNLAFTYFAPAEQQRTLSRLAEQLSPGGLLIIGAHEKLPAGHRFEQVVAGPIYRLAR